MSQHRYKRRRYDEAVELARQHFRAEALAHFSKEEIEGFLPKCAIEGGPPRQGWPGEQPTEKDYYEVMLAEASTSCGSGDGRVWVRFLVPRDRGRSDISAIWNTGGAGSGFPTPASLPPDADLRP